MVRSSIALLIGLNKRPAIRAGRARGQRSSRSSGQSIRLSLRPSVNGQRPSGRWLAGWRCTLRPLIDSPEHRDAAERGDRPSPTATHRRRRRIRCGFNYSARLTGALLQHGVCRLEPMAGEACEGQAVVMGCDRTLRQANRSAKSNRHRSERCTARGPLRARVTRLHRMRIGIAAGRIVTLEYCCCAVAHTATGYLLFIRQTATPLHPLSLPPLSRSARRPSLCHHERRRAAEQEAGGCVDSNAKMGDAQRMGSPMLRSGRSPVRSVNGCSASLCFGMLVRVCPSFLFRRPCSPFPDSDFQQQRLKAWQPLLTPKWVR